MISDIVKGFSKSVVFEGPFGPKRYPVSPNN